MMWAYYMQNWKILSDESWWWVSQNGANDSAIVFEFWMTGKWMMMDSQYSREVWYLQSALVRTTSKHNLKALKEKRERERIESRLHLRQENYHKTEEKERKRVSEVLILSYTKIPTLMWVIHAVSLRHSVVRLGKRGKILRKGWNE